MSETGEEDWSPSRELFNPQVATINYHTGRVRSYYIPESMNMTIRRIATLEGKSLGEVVREAISIHAEKRLPALEAVISKLEAEKGQIENGKGKGKRRAAPTG